MKSLERLSLAALREAGRQCCVRTDRDEKTLRDRVEMEGVSFLTITLPSFEKDLTRALLRKDRLRPLRWFCNHEGRSPEISLRFPSPHLRRAWLRS